MKIEKFSEFINESRENIFDGLSDIIIDRFNNKEYNFTINEYFKSSQKRIFKIKKLEVKFHLNKDSENFCNGLCDVTKSEIKDDYLVNPIFIFEVGYSNLNDDFIRYIHSVIKHEVLHLYQVYNLKINNKFKPESWVIGSLIPTFRRFFKEEYVKNILDLLYKSLSHEIYSQLQQYYFYKKDNLEYKKINIITDELSNFKIKKTLNEYEISEITNLKNFILKGLKNNDNKKYNKDVDKSMWNDSNIHSFLEKLDLYFKQKVDLIKNKIRKIDNELDIDIKINEALNQWISLPTNLDKTEVSHFQISHDLLIDVFY
jgi:hypothetical protein